MIVILHNGGQADVSPAVVGDVLVIEGQLHAVRDRCDDADTRGFYCTPCKQALANLLQLQFHVDDGRPHCVARICRFHGLESL